MHMAPLGAQRNGCDMGFATSCLMFVGRAWYLHLILLPSCPGAAVVSGCGLQTSLSAPTVEAMVGLMLSLAMQALELGVMADGGVGLAGAGGGQPRPAPKAEKAVLSFAAMLLLTYVRVSGARNNHNGRCPPVGHGHSW
jgi:hypothetical protein